MTALAASVRAWPSAVPALALAALAGLATGLARDPTDALAPLLTASLFLCAALAPLELGLVLCISTIAIGIFGRVPLFAFGAKPVALRAEEAAVVGLAVRGGLALWNTRGAPSLVAWRDFTLLAVALYALSIPRWGLDRVPAGGLYLARWVAFGTVFFAAARMSESTENRRRLAAAIRWSALALSVLGFVQWALLPDMADLKRFIPQLYESLTDPHIGRLVSTVLDPNLLGALLAMAACLSFAQALLGPSGSRLPASLHLTVLLAALGLTVSRGSMLATIAGIAAISVLVAPRLLWLAAPALAGGAALAPKLADRFAGAFWSRDGVPLELLGLSLRPEPSAYARIRSWVTGLQVASENPVLGVGYNNFGVAAADIDSGAALLGATDSSLLLILATCGVVGLALFVRLLWRIVADALSAARAADPELRPLGAGVAGAVVALVVASTFTNALIYPPVLVVLWVLAGTVSGAARARDLTTP